MTATAFTAADLRALAAAHVDATLFRAEDGRYWTNVVTKDHAVPVAEVHEAEADLYMVLEGAAELYLGGTVSNPTSPAPGQVRGDGLDGAVCRGLAPGDVVVIPPGTPHMVDARRSRLVYLVVKIATKY